MLLKLIDVELNYDSLPQLQSQVIDSVVGEVFEVDNADELVDLIAKKTGRDVLSLDYFQICESF